MWGWAHWSIYPLDLAVGEIKQTHLVQQIIWLPFYFLFQTPFHLSIRNVSIHDVFPELTSTWTELIHITYTHSSTVIYIFYLPFSCTHSMNMVVLLFMVSSYDISAFDFDNICLKMVARCWYNVIIPAGVFLLNSIRAWLVWLSIPRIDTMEEGRFALIAGLFFRDLKMVVLF